MGLFDLIKRGKTSPSKDFDHLTLSKMKKGYMVDYDLKTWEVIQKNCYDWGEGDVSHEWHLKSYDDVVFLEMETDDEESWSLNRKISFARLDDAIKEQIIASGDPPQRIIFEGKTYYLEETAGGHFFSGCTGQGREMLRWSYEDETGQSYLGIEQWGERDFDATLGQLVEPYQFTHILPGT
jgi:hypothetical protein